MKNTSNPSTTTTKHIYSVSQLNQETRLLMESHFPSIWVSGEISNIARPSSGHWYFSLKDANAQVRCAMFKFKNAHVNFRPDNGTEVLIRAKVSLYEGRGDFQLIAEFMEEAGDGALRREFEKLKRSLAQQGLFDQSSKTTIPSFARTLGVITSDSGAALRDILQVLKRRFSSLPVIIYHTQVQGKQSAASIATAITTANKHAACDVLILARGGGSLEDLWGFNEESVAKAIFDSNIPIISGIGHEVDFTIADFVADMRAPTPSAAAELVSPDKAALLNTCNMQLRRLQQAMSRILSDQSQALKQLKIRLQSPSQKLQQYAQRCDDMEMRLQRAWQASLQRLNAKLQTLTIRFCNKNPQHHIDSAIDRLVRVQSELQRSALHQIDTHKQALASLARALDSVSPLATLGRGYAIVQNNEQGIIQNANDCEVGNQLKVRLHKGELVCRVEQVEKNKEISC